MRKREIGSEFWDAPVSAHKNNLFPDTTQWFLSGRSALQAIIQELKQCRTVALPSWCCDSMIKPFEDAGMAVRFYSVYFQGELRIEETFDSDAILLMDFFGYTAAGPDLREYNGVVIRDTTHSLFSASYADADYYFGSLRKWCGVWTGGYAWNHDGHALVTGTVVNDGYTDLRDRAMQLKAMYINADEYTDNPAAKDKGYLKVFEDAEEMLETIGIAPAVERDVEIARRLDVDLIKTRRRQNAKVLQEAFDDWLIFPDVSPTDCPMFVPVLVPDGQRDQLRRYLIGQEIYCPVHWPVSQYHRLTGKERCLYDNELSLVCDQRYSTEDMNRMVEAIRAFRKEG